MYFTRTWEICQNYLEKLTDPELVSWNFITGGEQDDSHRFSVSEKNNSRVESRNCFFGPFSMTYLLELTIRKIYTDHKFAKSLLAADQPES